MYEYGGFWRRVGAYLIDTIILQIALGIIGGVMGVGIGMTTFMGDSVGDVMAMGAATTALLVSLVGTWLYFALMESSPMQATVGKLAVGVVVADAHGDRISFMRATGRYFAKIISGMILLIGFIMVAFTEKKQGFHDMIAGTVVFKTRDPASVRSEAAVFE